MKWGVELKPELCRAACSAGVVLGPWTTRVSYVVRWAESSSPEIRTFAIRPNICIKNSELKVWPLARRFFKPHAISSLNLTVCPVNIFSRKYMKAWLEALPLHPCRGWQCDINVKTELPKADMPRLIWGNKVLLERLAGMQGWYFFIYWLQ